VRTTRNPWLRLHSEYLPNSISEDIVGVHGSFDASARIREVPATSIVLKHVVYQDFHWVLRVQKMVTLCGQSRLRENLTTSSKKPAPYANRTADLRSCQRRGKIYRPRAIR
jgi:hypothetical protein